MKSAYELAMERLNKSSPTVKISPTTKKELAELDSRYAAKIAERELFIKGELAKAAAAGDFESAAQLEKQLASNRKSLEAELQDKKDAVRAKASVGGK